ncbi:MAG TPA: tetratricopeptide repeat protein [Rhodothermales bacterium]|nr:tetratricopeptide repeat protein [Rhodothermales bacterium]
MLRFFLLCSFVTAMLAPATHAQSLVQAAQANNLAQVTQLLAQKRPKANPNETDANGATSLMWAAFHGNVDMMRQLRAKGADCRKKGVIYDSTAAFGSILAAAAGRGHQAAVQFALDECKIPVDDREYDPNTKQANGWTALEWALSQNKPEIVTYLATQKANLNLENPQTGRLPVFYSIEQFSSPEPHTIEKLICNGLDLNAIDQDGHNLIRVIEKNITLLKPQMQVESSINEYQVLFAKILYYISLKEVIERPICSVNDQVLRNQITIQISKANELKNQQKYTESIKILEDALNKLGLLYFSNTIEIIKLKQTLSVLYEKQRQYGKALLLAEEIYEERVSILGEKHVLTLMSKANLPPLYESMGQYTKMAEIANQLAKDALIFLGSTHEITIRAEEEAAIAYYRLGEYRLAISFYNTSIDKNYLIGNKERVAINKSNLALVYQDIGDYQKALLLLQESLNSMTEIRGEENINTIGIKLFLAQQFELLGLYKDAEPLFIDVIAKRIKHLGHTHPHTLTAKNNYASLLSQTGRINKSINLLQQVYSTQVRIFGQEHPTIATTYNNIAAIYIKAGRYNEALIYAQKAVKIRETILGKSHLATLVARNNLGGILFHLGKQEEALILLNEVLNELIQSLGKEHPQTLTTQNNIAGLYQEAGKYENAIILFNDVHLGRKNTLGANHLETIKAQSNIATTLQRKGNYKESEDLYEEISPTMEKVDSLNLINIGNKISIGWEWGDSKYYLELPKLVGKMNRLIDKELITLNGLNSKTQHDYLSQNVFPSMYFNLSLGVNDIILKENYTIFWFWKSMWLFSLSAQNELEKLIQTKPELKEDINQVYLLKASLYLLDRRLELSENERQQLSNEMLLQIETLEQKLAPYLTNTLENDPLRKAGWDGFRQKLPQDAAFVDMYGYDHYEKGKPHNDPDFRYVGIITTPQGGLYRVQLPDTATVSQAWRGWLKVKDQSNTAEQRNAWNEVRRLVWQPIAAQLPASVKRVYLSPDGVLAQIPWQLFAQNDMKPREVAIVESARELYRLLTTSYQKPATPQYLAVGNINYNDVGAEPQTTENLQNICQKALGENSTIRNATSTPCAQSVIDNTSAILKQKGYESQSIVHNDATRSRIQAALPKANVAMFFTHGYYDAGTDDRNSLTGSWLALSQYNKPDSTATTDETAFTGEDFVALDLRNTELMILSACKSGLGKPLLGQGTLGVRASISTAGVRSILMSLWNVPEFATKLMVEAFMKHWQSGKSKSEALRLAQDEVRKYRYKDSGGTIHTYEAPHFWAGWTLSGEIF